VGEQWGLRRRSRREWCWGAGCGDIRAGGDRWCKPATSNRCGQPYHMLYFVSEKYGAECRRVENEKAFLFSFSFLTCRTGLSLAIGVGGANEAPKCHFVMSKMPTLRHYDINSQKPGFKLGFENQPI
jgi:hypothetical protein